MAAHAEEWDAGGHALVVCNGVARSRKVTTGGRRAGDEAPRVNDRREGSRFTSKILPAWAQGPRGPARPLRVPGRALAPPRPTNAIESTFATVRLRTRKIKGAGSRSAGLAMAYKLLEAAQARWRCINARHLAALVRPGATFVDGVKVEREDQRNAA